MLNIFVCIVLAHVLSDFVFQTNFIYKLKAHTKYGVYVHVGIFFFLSVLFLLPFSLNLSFLFWLILVTISHYFIDKIKLFFQRNIIQKELVHFFLDQSLHFIILCSFFIFFKETGVTSFMFEYIKSFFGLSKIDAEILFIKIIFSIYVGYGISVILYYYDRTVDLQVEMLKHNYLSMLIRVCVFLLLISKYFWVGIFLIILLRFVLKRRLVYDGRRFVIENLSLLIFVILFIPIRFYLIGAF